MALRPQMVWFSVIYTIINQLFTMFNMKIFILIVFLKISLDYSWPQLFPFRSSVAYLSRRIHLLSCYWSKYIFRHRFFLCFKKEIFTQKMRILQKPCAMMSQVWLSWEFDDEVKKQTSNKSAGLKSYSNQSCEKSKILN